MEVCVYDIEERKIDLSNNNNKITDDNNGTNPDKE